MADLEAVLADVSYLMAMEKSKSTPAARASKKMILPDASYVLFYDFKSPAKLLERVISIIIWVDFVLYNNIMFYDFFWVCITHM